VIVKIVKVVVPRPVINACLALSVCFWRTTVHADSAVWNHYSAVQTSWTNTVGF